MARKTVVPPVFQGLTFKPRRPRNSERLSESRRWALLNNNYRNKIWKGRVRLPSQESREEPMMHLMPPSSFQGSNNSERWVYEKEQRGNNTASHSNANKNPAQQRLTKSCTPLFPRSTPIACSVRSRRSNPMLCSLLGKTITVTSIAKRSAWVKRESPESYDILLARQTIVPIIEQKKADDLVHRYTIIYEGCVF